MGPQGPALPSRVLSAQNIAPRAVAFGHRSGRFDGGRGRRTGCSSHRSVSSGAAQGSPGPGTLITSPAAARAHDGASGSASGGASASGTVAAAAASLTAAAQQPVLVRVAEALEEALPLLEARGELHKDGPVAAQTGTRATAIGSVVSVPGTPLSSLEEEEHPAVPPDVLREFEHKLEADLKTVGFTLTAVTGVIIYWRGVWSLLDYYIGDSVFGDICCIIVGLTIVLWIRLSGIKVATSLWPPS